MFEPEVVEPIRALASKTIDQGAIVGGIFLPGTISDKVIAAYRQAPVPRARRCRICPETPRFVINATSVQTGALFRFSRPFIADYRIGTIPKPDLELAVAVAASSAFPPVLSPCQIELDPSAWAPATGHKSEDLHREPFLSEAVLTDGGVYDNLGLETAWKRYQTILVSNGGGKMAGGGGAAHATGRATPSASTTSSTTRSAACGRDRSSTPSRRATAQGRYWGIRTCIDDYQLGTAMPCPEEKTIALANTRPGLKRMDAVTQERLINWGYAVCDAAMRKHVETGAPAPAGFPYPASGIG